MLHEVHHYHHYDPAFEGKLDRILNALNQLGVKEMADLSKLTADVAANTNTTSSIITLINNIAAELKAANGDQAQVDALVAQLEANTASLAGAVTSNTVAADDINAGA